MKTTLLIAAAFLVCTLAPAQSNRGPALAKGQKLFVSVLSGSVNNSVGLNRRVGVFVRAQGDSGWRVVPNTNTLAFGSGYSGFGDSVRYYACGGNGLFRSEDAGASWRMLTGWNTMEVLDVAVDPQDRTNIYIATPFGVFRSTDDGATWRESIRGMKKWYVQDVMFDRADPNVLYAVSEDDMYRSKNKGAVWSALHAGFTTEVRAMLQHPADRNILLAGSEDKGIRVTHDGGSKWMTGKGSEGQTILAFASSGDGAALYAAGFKTGVLKSTDRGRTWNKVSDSSLACEAVYAMLVDPRDSSHLLLGGNGSGLWESNDAGATWRQTELPGTHIMHLGIYR